MMKLFLLLAVHMICCSVLLQHKSLPSAKNYFYQNKINAAPADLFSSDEVLTLKLSGGVRELFNDRGDDGAYHPLRLTYKGADSNEVSFMLKAKTRGNFRRDKANCTYPPILLNFQKKETTQSALFKDQDKLKLVTPCRSDEYVIREYLVYKLYNLITPKSFRARLVKVNFYDTVRKKEAASFYSILLEEDAEMAKRNKSVIITRKMNGENTETETFLKMAVFEYMIGNTDWSVPYFHNTRIIAFDSASIPSVVPYDFDHAGIVDAPYAAPPEELGMRSTQERRFRGYCITDFKTFDEVIATFNRLKQDFYNVYTNCKLLDTRYVKSTTRFLDLFYETINNPKKVRSEFTYPCKKGVSNFIIKGLGKE